VADIVIEKGLGWLVRVPRMGTETLTRPLLYSQLCEGSRNRGRLKLRFKDVMKRYMKQ